MNLDIIANIPRAGGIGRSCRSSSNLCCSRDGRNLEFFSSTDLYLELDLLIGPLLPV